MSVDIGPVKAWAAAGLGGRKRDKNRTPRLGPTKIESSLHQNFGGKRKDISAPCRTHPIKIPSAGP
jgi:hypothetical protein